MVVKNRATAIHAGNIGRREAIQRRDVATTQANAERIARADYARQQQEYAEALRQAQNQAEEEARGQQTAFYFANRERMSFTDVGGGARPTSQADIEQLIKERPDLQQKLAALEKKRYEESKAQIVLRQQQKAYAPVQVVTKEQAVFKEEPTQEDIRKANEAKERLHPEKNWREFRPGANESYEEGLVREGFSPEEARTFLRQEEQNPNAHYKIVVTTTSSGQKSFSLVDTTQEEMARDTKLMTQYVKKAPVWEKAAIYSHTILTPEGWKLISEPVSKYFGAKDTRSAEQIAAERVITTGKKYSGKNAVDLLTSKEFLIETAQSPVVTAEMMYGGTLVAGKILSAPTIVKLVGGETGVKLIGGALGLSYASARGGEVYNAYTGGDTQKVTELLMRTGVEVGAMSVAGRSLIRESTMKQFEGLPPKERAEALRKFKAAEILGEKTPRPANVRITGKNIPKEARPIFEEYLRGRKLGVYIGGSQAIEPQLLPKFRKIPKSDLDVYLEGFRSPKKEANILADMLTKGGVKRVSARNGELTIGGKKAVEFHPAKEYLFSNIKTVESALKPTRLQIVKTKKGIKLLKIGTQLKREVVRYYTESKGRPVKKTAEYKFKMEQIFKSQIEYHKKFVIPRSLPGIKYYRTLRVAKAEELLYGEKLSAKDVMIKLEKSGMIAVEEKSKIFSTKTGKEIMGKTFMKPTGKIPVEISRSFGLKEAKITLQHEIHHIRRPFATEEKIVSLEKEPLTRTDIAKILSTSRVKIKARNIVTKIIKTREILPLNLPKTNVRVGKVGGTYSYKPISKVLVPSSYKKKEGYKTPGYIPKAVTYTPKYSNKNIPYKSPVKSTPYSRTPRTTPPYKPKAVPYPTPYKTPPYKAPPYKPKPTTYPTPYEPPPYPPRSKKQTNLKFKQGKKKVLVPKRLYSGTTKYKPSLLGVMLQRKITKAPKRTTGVDIRAILVKRRRK